MSFPRSRSPSRAVYKSLGFQRVPARRRRSILLLLLAAALLAFALRSAIFLRRISSSIALSDATDAVTIAVNELVAKQMRERDNGYGYGYGYGYDYFVTLEKDADGMITAITTNTARVNAFAAEILSEMVDAANSGELNIRIPLGSLLGSSLLLGMGPDVPVNIDMLTSSFVRFDNALTSTGINQSRHTLTLKASVDIDIIIPWASLSTTVETDILIAETVIVGRVPDTYVNVEDTNG